MLIPFCAASSIFVYMYVCMLILMLSNPQKKNRNGNGKTGDYEREVFKQNLQAGN